MPRRKPTSTRKKKADIQLKRAIKRGDAPPPDPNLKVQKSKLRRGPKGKAIGSVSNPTNAANISSARRLQSAFITLPPKFLEETKLLASKLSLNRPIPDEVTIFPLHLIDHDGTNAPKLTCPRRPKWRFDMTKKEVEHNEEGLFNKWLEQTDELILAWQGSNQVDAGEQEGAATDETTLPKEINAMPQSPTYFERNLEVWRQLWRVTEISQILLVLLDSRCPLLHLPPSLVSYLSDRRVILVLTKVDISGSERATAWMNYFHGHHPHLRVVEVESYIPKGESAHHQGRTQYEPHLPQAFRERLVAVIRDVHAEMLSPPETVRDNPKRLENWKPSVKRDVDWDSMLKVGDLKMGSKISTYIPGTQEEGDGEATENQDGGESELLTIGLIGQPNVGKSSLLNALFGTSKVRASKTPGKTKHFQTLFWTPEVRLVDCPGLVMPNFVPMEIQALCGILPISRISAIPSCIHYVSERLPIERIYNLNHPSSSSPSIIDKRTWRAGVGPRSLEEKLPIWTAMDVLTAYANMNKWLTAKAGRPDIHRAGNAILRSVAEGKIGWAYWPPGIDITIIKTNMEEQGNGLYISRATTTDTTDGESTNGDDQYTSNYTSSESQEMTSDDESSDSDDENAKTRQIHATGRFGTLAIDDVEDEEVYEFT